MTPRCSIISRCAGDRLLMEGRAHGERRRIAMAVARGEPVDTDTIAPYSPDSRLAELKQAFEGRGEVFVQTTRWGGYVRRGPVAIVPICGGIWFGENIMTWLFGDTTVAEIGATLDAAAADGAAETVILEIDSPGGATTAMAEIAASMRRLVAAKHTIALARPAALSLANVFVGLAHRAVAQPGAMLGSLGAVWPDIDDSAMYAAAGIVSASVATGSDKLAGFPGEPIPESVKARRRASVERDFAALMGIMNEGPRPLNESKVRALQGAVLDPEDALSLGLIDGVMTLDELLEELDAAANAAVPPATTGPTPTARAAGKTGALAMADDTGRDDKDMQTIDEEDEPMTAARLEEEYPELVAEIRADERAKAAESEEDEGEPAAFAELDGAFAADPAFVTEALRNKWSMAKARAEFAGAKAATAQRERDEALARAKAAEDKLAKLGVSGAEAVSTGPSAGKPPKTYDEAVAHYKAQGQSTAEAHKSAKTNHPDLHKQYLGR